LSVPGPALLDFADCVPKRSGREWGVQLMTFRRRTCYPVRMNQAWCFEYNGELFNSAIISGYKFQPGNSTRFEANSSAQSEIGRAALFEFLYNSGAVRSFSGIEALRINFLLERAFGRAVMADFGDWQRPPYRRRADFVPQRDTLLSGSLSHDSLARN
jgi:hypothetical protein